MPRLTCTFRNHARSTSPVDARSFPPGSFASSSFTLRTRFLTTSLPKYTALYSTSCIFHSHSILSINCFVPSGSFDTSTCFKYLKDAGSSSYIASLSSMPFTAFATGFSPAYIGGTAHSFLRISASIARRTCPRPTASNKACGTFTPTQS